MFWKKEPKKSLSEISRQFALSIPVPKTKKYKTILTLLEDAERWRNVGDAELEKKTWQMLSEKASLYADGMREKYETEYATKCGIVCTDTNTVLE
jgi:hypothetical protein